MKPKSRRSSNSVPPSSLGPAAWGHRRLGPSLFALLFVLVVLLATIDDRHVGRTADERQVIWAAVALVETGQLAQAVGHDFAFVRADGEAVSRYGIGMTLLQVPAAWLAPRVEAWLGGGASQPLFLVVPILLVLGAAWFAGRAARALRGGETGAAFAVLLAGLGSPLGSYAAMSFSEPLQALALAAGFAAALHTAASQDERSARRAAFSAGVAAGIGLLAKSPLVAVMPFVLLPLLAKGRRRETGPVLAYAAAGALPGMALWAWFEWVRFGRFFASYPGEGFTHPFLDGLWRLTIGPNAGFFLFFPLSFVALWWWVRSARSRDWRRFVEIGAAVCPFLMLLGVSASWWAWHGVWGWGPRLLVPAVAPLAAVVGAALAGWRRPFAVAALVVSALLNLPGLLQHPVPVLNYVSNLAWPQVTAAEAERVAGYARERDPDGSWRIGPDHVLAKIPQASPLLVYPWFYRATAHADLASAATDLQSPPWRSARPDLLPVVQPVTPEWLEFVIGPPRARFWGRGFRPSAADVQYAAVYDEALADQVLRLLQRQDARGALALATKLVALARDGWHDALVLECYRVLGDRPGAAAYLSSLPSERRAHRAINVVLALFERDAGHEELARRFLDSSADSYPPDAPIRAAVGAPLSQWPPTLHAMTEGVVKGAGE